MRERERDRETERQRARGREREITGESTGAYKVLCGYCRGVAFKLVSNKVDKAPLCCKV